VNGLLDTSVVIAAADGERLALPEDAAVSVMTIAELHVGVIRARTQKQRAGRARTMAAIERDMEVLPVEERVARCFAEIVSAAREDGRRPGVADALIAATAMAHDLPLYTLDDDFAGLAGVRVVRADRPD
jgi:predicted nucleic acid-binding protein